MSSLSMPQLYLFLIIRHVTYSYIHNVKHSVSILFVLYETPLYLVMYIVLENNDFFHEMFQVGACSNLKYFLII